MSFRMNVRVDEIVEDGDYEAVLDHIDQITATFQGEESERLKWVFRIPDKHDAEIVGFTSMSPSTRAKPYQWAEVLMGEINPKIGWGPDDVEGKRCRIFVGTTKDAQGDEKNRVEKVLKSRISDNEPEAPDFKRLAS
jgi:hypothetical protein